MLNDFHLNTDANCLDLPNKKTGSCFLIMITMCILLKISEPLTVIYKIIITLKQNC